MGVPKQEFDRVKSQLTIKEKEISELQRGLNQKNEEMKGKLDELQQISASFDKINKEKEQIQNYLHQKEDEVAAMRAEIRTLKQKESEVPA